MKKLIQTIKGALAILPLLLLNNSYAQFTGGIGGGYAKSGKVNTTLPVHFITLEAKNENKFINLTWKVENEINVKNYHIERSKNGQDFRELGVIDPSPNSLTRKEYHFTDSYPETSFSFYRIKEEDIDGKYTYSQVIKVNYTNNEGLALFPNPSSSFICINNIPVSGNQNCVIQIFNNKGQVIKKISTRYTDLSINIANLSAGTYYIQLEIENQLQIKRTFIKQ